MRPVLFGVTVLPLVTAGVVLAFLTLGNASRLAQYAAVLPLSYLIGSLPWGYLLLRWRHGVDIRQLGSGRIGTSNVLRTAGGKAAVAVLALDLGKGVLAVMLARVVIGTTTGEVAAGLMALVGHNWPVFLRFRGGRGIATGVGGLLVMALVPAVVATLSFITVTLISRYLSLGSITSVIVACLSLVGLTVAGMYSSIYWVYAFLGGAMIIWQHRDNIQRIWRGNERRLGQPAGKAD
jgi:glycerol-3-phosphate acyltransferase PlsY